MTNPINQDYPTYTCQSDYLNAFDLLDESKPADKTIQGPYCDVPSEYEDEF